MANLNLLEQEVLPLLRRLEYRCESVGLQNPEEIEKKGFIEIMVSDVDFKLISRRDMLKSVEAYLQKNGLDFSITANLDDDTPEEYDLDYDYVPIGIIKGENIEAIKTKIENIISELEDKKTEPKKVKYNTDLGQFVFNDGKIIQLEGKQKDVAECLALAGKNKKVSWDVIHGKIEGLPEASDALSKKERISTKKSIRGAVSEINGKIEKHFGSKISFINFKKNEYWLTYDVEKDG